MWYWYAEHVGRIGVLSGNVLDEINYIHVKEWGVNIHPFSKFVNNTHINNYIHHKTIAVIMYLYPQLSSRILAPHRPQINNIYNITIEHMYVRITIPV